MRSSMMHTHQRCSLHLSMLLLLISLMNHHPHLCSATPILMLDDTVGLGRSFDGIGGLSAGGTSKLLADYKDPYRSDILDYLFKPGFGASLQILKVEIGGDSPAADATEASHMHNATDENYHRGYEWWLMEQAKQRNPDIKLYGLPWSFPAWLGNGTRDPYNDPNRLATYIVKWVKGAKQVHNLNIDYVGVWNEERYDIGYIKTLRQELDKNGFGSTRIVASDDVGSTAWDIVKDVSSDATLDSAIDVIGVHYPGTQSPQNAVLLGKPLWSSEDYSTVNDDVGGGCLARIINQNYVNGRMTSTIAWNLIDSYLEGLPWDRDSLMTARQPWSGHYTVETPIWVSAHTSQFSSPGWHYLRHGYGVGLLDKGGSIVSLVSPDASQLTVVIETMSHDHSQCIRPALPDYNVTHQNVTLQLMGSFVDVQELQVWFTKLDSQGSSTFTQLSPVKVVSGQVHMSLGVDEIYTLTTVTTGQKGDHGEPPAAAPFDIEYFGYFQLLEDGSEAPYFSAQQGVFEAVTVSAYDKRLRQMVLETPIPWCPTTASLNATMNVIGNANWSDIYVRTEAVMVPVNGSSGVFLAARIDKTGCETYLARGLFFFLFPRDGLFLLTKDLGGNEVIHGGRNSQVIDKVDNMMELLVYKGYVSGKVNKMPLFNVSLPADIPARGFVGLGTDSYGYADFEYFDISNPADPHLSGRTRGGRRGDNPLYFSPESQ